MEPKPGPHFSPMDRAPTLAAMSGIVRLPQPPLYAVIAPAVLDTDTSGYPEMAATALRNATTLDGFHGIEMCAQPGFSLAVSYWDSLEAIDAWRHHPQHQQAKAAG